MSRDSIERSDGFSQLAENVRRDMLYAEAQERGLIPDDATDVPTIPDDVLAQLGLMPSEVGQ